MTRPIEDAVAGINGVKRVISTSAEGLAMVGIELRLEIDPQAATAEVREKVAAIRARLPEQIKDPTINRFDVVGVADRDLRCRIGNAVVRRHAAHG